MANSTRYRRSSVRSVSTAVALFALSCSGSGQVSQENLVPAASAGDEPPPPSAASAEPKSSRGRIVVQARCAGQNVEAHGRMPIERDLVVDFDMGQEFTAEAGTRRIEVTLTQEGVLVDKPTRPIDVAVEADKLAKVNVVFPSAKVQLSLLINGKPQPATPLKLVRDGAVVAEVRSGGPLFQVTPGNYEAEVQVRNKTVRVKGLVFFESTDQVVPVRAQL
jgi:hypothetical protein